MQRIIDVSGRCPVAMEAKERTGLIHQELVNRSILSLFGVADRQSKFAG
jgi:hypothetical protein